MQFIAGGPKLRTSSAGCPDEVKRGSNGLERRSGGHKRGRTIRLGRLLLALVLSLPAARDASAQSVQHVLDEKAGAWAVIGRLDYGTIYLDTTQIVAMDQDIYQVRTLWRFARVQHDHEGELFRSSVAVRAIDCRANVSAILAFADQDGVRVVNSVVLSFRAAQWEAINAASVVDQIATRTCTLGRKTKQAARVASGG